jgi:hypothetical protein
MSEGYTGSSCRYIMIMGNYLSLRRVGSIVMAVRETPVGIAHPTVVPENFEPEESDADEDRPDDG